MDAKSTWICDYLTIGNPILEICKSEQCLVTTRVILVAIKSDSNATQVLMNVSLNLITKIMALVISQTNRTISKSDEKIYLNGYIFATYWWFLPISTHCWEIWNQDSSQLFFSCLLKVNSSPCGQIVYHFADDIFKCILIAEKFCIAIQISLKFVPTGRIDNKLTLVQVIAWCWTGNKPLPEPRLT